MGDQGEIIESERKGIILAHRGYLYNLHSRNSNRTKLYWVCRRKPNCTKRAISTAPNANTVHVSKAVDHDHPPSQEEVEALRRCIALKRAAENEPVAGPSQIIQRELEGVPSGVLPFLPLRESLKRNMNKRRQKKFLINPKSLADLQALPQEVRVTTTGEQFLIFDSYDDHDSDDEDDFDRIIVFSSKSHLKLLSRSATWYIDGTFGTAPNIFTQIVTVHGEYQDKALVFVYSLLPNKRKESYELILTSIVQQCSNYGWDGVEPSVIICDFEMSIIRAVQSTFPRATIRLCYFHLKQSAWRKIQEMGLQTAYNSEEDNTTRQKFGELLSLAFVPVEEVSPTFDVLLRTIPRQMIDFAKYFQRTYIGTQVRGRRRAVVARYQPVLWNQFQAARNNEPRTNNKTEAWHTRFASIVAKKHPSLYKLIHHIQKEQSDVDTMVRELDVGRRITEPQKRKYYNLNVRLQNITSRYYDYKDGGNIIAYLHACAHNMAI